MLYNIKGPGDNAILKSCDKTLGQYDKIMSITERDSLLSRFKTKAAAHFNQKLLQICDDTFFEIRFTVRWLFFQTQEF